MNDKSIGRPTVLDEATVQKLLDAFKYGSSVKDACYYAGISRSTYYQNTHEDNEFMDKVTAAKNYLKMKATMLVGKEIIDRGNIKLAQWYLEKSGLIDNNDDPKEKESVASSFFSGETYGEVIKMLEAAIEVYKQKDPSTIWSNSS